MRKMGRLTKDLYCVGIFVHPHQPAGAQGVNHDIPVDGRTAVLTVTLVKKSKK